MTFSGFLRSCLLAMGAAFLLAGAAQAQWASVNPNAPAPIRFVTRSQGHLLGGRVGGNPNAIEVLSSTDDGAHWQRTGTVATSATSQFGDPCFLSDGSPTVYCAFREHQAAGWQITLCRSEDGGGHWLPDSVVASSPEGRFIGAPCLWFSRGGDLQCYYDSEQAAEEAGHPGWQWIAMRARPKNAVGSPWSASPSIACRPADANTFARDGMASVVDLGGSAMLLVCEGIDPANPARNCLYTIHSRDNGRTWDFASRRRIWSPIKNGVEFNAYNPMALRLHDGSIGIAFCTDDDFPAPSLDSAPVDHRNAHVKFIRSRGTFADWDAAETIDASQSTMYNPGLFATTSGTLFCTIDHLNGSEIIRRR